MGWPNLHWHHGYSFFHATTNYWMMNKADEVLALTELTGRRQVIRMIILSCSHGTRGLETQSFLLRYNAHAVQCTDFGVQLNECLYMCTSSSMLVNVYPALQETQSPDCNFAHYHGVNPIMANFKSLMWYHRTQSWEEIHTIGSYEQVGATLELAPETLCILYIHSCVQIKTWKSSSTLEESIMPPHHQGEIFKKCSK